MNNIQADISRALDMPRRVITTPTKANKIDFDFKGFFWVGIENDIRDAWDKKFGEDNVSIVLMDLREYLKRHPHYSDIVLATYGGNWAIWIWDCLERAKGWKNEK